MTNHADAPRPGAEPKPPDRRTRRREERRDHVYRTAVGLFVARGYQNTTMEDIAEHADVARATVFNHFQRKLAFIEEWAAQRRERAMAVIRTEHLEDHSVGEILARYLHELALINIGSRTETVALLDTALQTSNVLRQPALGQELARYIARGQRHGEVPADVDAERAGYLLAAGYFTALSRWIGAEPEPFDLDAELRKVLVLVLHGILADE